MSYQERRAIVSLISALLIPAVYFSMVFQRYPAGDAYSREVFHFWGAAFLIFIPVTIAANILIYIVFHILNAIATREVDDDLSVTDERDRLIELKSGRNGLYVFMVGFILAMASLVLDQPPAVMFSILVLAGIASQVAGDLWQFHFYRNGV